MIDTTKLEAGLAKLKGHDLIALEKEERLTGNTALELTTSKSFQVRVAARALGVNPHDLLDLPINESNAICIQTFGFLNKPVEPPT